MKLFRRTSTLRVKRKSSHEIDPEDVFIDSQNLSSLNLDQLEGQLERPLGKHIFYIAVAASLLLLVGFSYRLFAMQIVQVDEYTEKADSNHLKKLPLFALRGTIADRNGELLAWNSLYSISASRSR
jgi:hypothetical protein